MKLSLLFRNSLLPLFCAGSILCVSSCSKEAIPEQTPDAEAQTRATPSLVISCSPFVGNSYELNTDYTFTVDAFPLGTVISNVQINVQLLTDGYQIVNRGARSMTIRFTSPGEYSILATADIGVLAAFKGIKCYVPAR